jgi:glycerol uptake facilitator-like aquaporin
MDTLNRWINVQPSIMSKFCVEFTATMFFHFIGSLSPTPWANGIALMILIFYSAKISGAHINPAASYVFMILGFINPIEILMYCLAQISGAIVGALWLALLVPNLYIRENIVNQPYSGCFTSDLEYWNIFGFEAIGTFCFFLPIYSVVWYTTHKDGYGAVGPIIIGLSLLANALAIGSFTGGAFNPARVIGSSVVFRCNNSSYIGYYIFGEFIGASLVPFLIIPWYGIANNAWYLSMLSDRAQIITKKINTMPKKISIV